jgi:hypothetical protein
MDLTKIAKIGGEIPLIGLKNRKMGDFALHNRKFPLILPRNELQSAFKRKIPLILISTFPEPYKKRGTQKWTPSFSYTLESQLTIVFALMNVNFFYMSWCVLCFARVCCRFFTLWDPLNG